MLCHKARCGVSDAVRADGASPGRSHADGFRDRSTQSPGILNCLAKPALPRFKTGEGSWTRERLEKTVRCGWAERLVRARSRPIRVIRGLVAFVLMLSFLSPLRAQTPAENPPAVNPPAVNPPAVNPPSGNSVAGETNPPVTAATVTPTATPTTPAPVVSPPGMPTVPPSVVSGGESAGTTTGAAASAASAANQTEPKSLREQTIYVPYDKLRRVFEREGRGVFLPYEKFQELWRQAQAGTVRPQPIVPPTDAVISEIDSTAVVEQEVVTVNARLQIELLSRGWLRVPLRLADAALRQARIGDVNAQVVFTAGQGYELLVLHERDEPGRIELQLEYSKAFTKTPGTNWVSFQAPQAAINRWRVRVPQAGIQVNIQPLIAASELPPAAPAASATPAPAPAPAALKPAPAGAAVNEPPMPVAANDGQPTEVTAIPETVLLAFVGVAPTVRIEWTPKVEGASGLEALATVETMHEVTVAEGVIRTRARLNYTISRAELTRLIVEVPADQKVTGVFDPNIRSWDVQSADNLQLVVMELFQPARGTQEVRLELERFVDQEMLRTTAVPLIRAREAGRQQGLLVVRSEEGSELRLEPTRRQGLVQLDTSELPTDLRARSWALAYRYAAVPYELVLQVEKLQPRVRATQLVEAVLTPRSLTLQQQLLLEITQAGLFQLEFEVPRGFEVEVEGREVASDGPVAEAAMIDTFRHDPETGRVQVQLARKALGRLGIVVRLRRNLDDANLLAPTGQVSILELTIPRLVTVVSPFRGRFVLYAPENLRVNLRPTANLRPVAVDGAEDRMSPLVDAKSSDARPLLAYVHGPEAVPLVLEVERRRPQITIRQALAVQIDAGVVKYDARFFYEILYSGVPALRIDIPADLAAQVNVASSDFRESLIEPPPADRLPGYVSWSLSRGSELQGQGSVQLTWETPLVELKVGQPLNLPLPVLRPRQVDRAWGQVVLAKVETLDIETPRDAAVGLRPLDPQHDLFPELAAVGQGAARAFEFQEDWALTARVTRYELQEIKRTSIDRTVLRMVITRSQRTTVQAIYRLRSSLQRLAVQLPAGAELDLDPLRINGQPRGLEQGEEGLSYIPLAEQASEKPLLVELRYTVSGEPSELRFPVFPAQPPVQSEPAQQEVLLSVYLPQEWQILATRGPWTAESESRFWLAEPIGKGWDDAQRLEWVSQDIDLDRMRLKSFPVDGRVARFTSLRPPAPPEGSLRLWVVHERWVHFWMFGVLGLVGVFCWRKPPGTLLLLLSLFLILILTVGIFWPTFAELVLTMSFWLGCGLLLVLWCLFGLARYCGVRAWAPTPPGPAHVESTVDEEDLIATVFAPEAERREPNWIPLTHEATGPSSPFAPVEPIESVESIELAGPAVTTEPPPTIETSRLDGPQERLSSDRVAEAPSPANSADSSESSDQEQGGRSS